jgi:hypothetical protein
MFPSSQTLTPQHRQLAMVKNNILSILTDCEFTLFKNQFPGIVPFVLGFSHAIPSMPKNTFSQRLVYDASESHATPIFFRFVNLGYNLTCKKEDDCLSW